MFSNIALPTPNFLEWDQWPEELLWETKCLHYACGLAFADTYNELIEKICSGDLFNNLEQLFKELGFCYRRIKSQAEIKECEYGIVVYDYLYSNLRLKEGKLYRISRREVHFARIKNGIWSHKCGATPPCLTSKEDIRKSILQDDRVEVEPAAYYAIHLPNKGTS